MCISTGKAIQADATADAKVMSWVEQVIKESRNHKENRCLEKSDQNGDNRGWGQRREEGKIPDIC